MLIVALLAAACVAAQTTVGKGDSELAIGQAAYEANSFEVAVSELKRALDLLRHHDSPTSKRLEALYALALAHSRAGQAPESIAVLRSAEELQDLGAEHLARFEEFARELLSALDSEIAPHLSHNSPPCPVRRAILSRADLAGLPNVSPELANRIQSRPIPTALEDQPGFRALYLERMGIAARNIGHYEGAETVFRDALDYALESESPIPFWESDLLMQIGETWLAAGQVTEASLALSGARLVLRTGLTEPDAAIARLHRRTLGLAEKYGAEEYATRLYEGSAAYHPTGPPLTDGDLIAPRILKRDEPELPAAARAGCMDGTVILSATIGTDGRAHNIDVARGVGAGLDDAAVRQVRVWEFEPAKRDGQDVPLAVRFEVSFRQL